MTPRLIKGLEMIAKAISFCAVAALLSGCMTHARYDNAQRLIARPDFAAARVAAPEWCRDALKTINELELEIERR